MFTWYEGIISRYVHAMAVAAAAGTASLTFGTCHGCDGIR
jgi:hypothetical protein